MGASKTEVIVEVGGVIKSATVVVIDGDHANPKAAWDDMGSPKVPSDEELVELKKASEVEEVVVELEENAEVVKLTVRPNSAILLRIVKG